MIRTPLLEDFYRTWRERAVNPVPLEKLIEDRDKQHLMLYTREKVSMTYHQVRKGGSGEDGAEGYEEQVTISLKGPGTMFVHKFYDRDGQVFHIGHEQGQGRSEKEYVKPGVSVKGMLESELDRTYVDGLLGHYDQFVSGDCDFIYFLTKDRDDNYNLAYFTDREHVEQMKRADDRKEGMMQLFRAGREQECKNPRLGSIAEVVEHLPDNRRIGLITTEWIAGRLIQKAHFDEQALLRSTLNIGGRELRLMGHGSKFTEDCIDYIFTSKRGMYRTMAWKKPAECERLFPGEDLSPEQRIEKAIILAETSDPVIYSRQMELIGRALKRGVEISDELLGWIGSVESRRRKDQQVFSIYDEYRMWCDIKESLGLDFEGALDDKALEPMTIGLREMFVSRFRGLCEQPGPGHAMLLYISREEEPEKRKDRNWKYKHVGTRNMVIDFGHGGAFSCLGGQRQEADALERFYDENRHDMRVWLFKGGILRQMLERILPEQGSRVAVDTCGERVEELASFCRVRDACTLNYRGVDMELVNSEALSALEHILKGDK